MAKIRTLIKEIKQSQELDIKLRLRLDAIGKARRYVSNQEFHRLKEKDQKRIVNMCKRREDYFTWKLRKELKRDAEIRKSLNYAMDKVIDSLFGKEPDNDFFGFSKKGQLKKEMSAMFDLFRVDGLFS